MGQKINPILYRLSANYADYSSHWFALNNRDYSNYVIEDYKIRKIINDSLSHASISKIVIRRNTGAIMLTIHSAKMGVLIGKNGIELNRLRAKLEKIVSSKVVIDLSEVKKYTICASLVAQNIANQIANRMSCRRAMKKAMTDAMRMSECEGFKACCSGRIGGAEIARSEFVKNGSIPLHNLRTVIDYASHAVDTTYGVIGVRVWINKGIYILNSKIEKKKNYNNSNDRSRLWKNRKKKSMQ